MSRIRILIAEDVALWQDGLRAYLEAQDGLEVLAVARSASEAKAIAAATPPDVAVVDMAIERVSGPAIAHHLLEAHGSRVVMLTMCEDEHCVRSILDIGVRGVVLKRSEGAELLNAIQAAAKGCVYIDSSLRPQIRCESVIQLAAQQRLDALNEKERALCRLLALGHTNTEAGALLGVSVRNVEARRSRIMAKLGAETRADLVNFALEMKLI